MLLWLRLCNCGTQLPQAMGKLCDHQQIKLVAPRRTVSKICREAPESLSKAATITSVSIINRIIVILSVTSFPEASRW
jgi:hypothetical protein